MHNEIQHDFLALLLLIPRIHLLLYNLTYINIFMSAIYFAV